MPTNPNSGLTLTEQMTTEQLIPANNLSDLPDRPLASTNMLGFKGVDLTVTAVAGAANVCTVTVQAKDANGVNVTGVHWLELITTSDSAGAVISVTAYSGTLVAGTGTLMITQTAKHAFLIATDSTGLFIGSLTDTAKTADYIAVKKPCSAGLKMSTTAMAFG